ncbi:hypothetical protein ABIA65_004675 [Mycolicibacterium sp. 624]
MAEADWLATVVAPGAAHGSESMRLGVWQRIQIFRARVGVAILARAGTGWGTGRGPPGDLRAILKPQREQVFL